MSKFISTQQKTSPTRKSCDWDVCASSSTKSSAVDVASAIFSQIVPNYKKSPLKNADAEKSNKRRNKVTKKKKKLHVRFYCDFGEKSPFNSNFIRWDPRQPLIEKYLT